MAKPPVPTWASRRHAEGGALAGVDRADVLAVDVGLDLPPERVAGAAAGEADLGDLDAHLADQLQAVAHGVGRPFEHRSDQMLSAVADGQADPAAAGVGVEVRGALAGQVGQEEQPLGAGRGQARPPR